MDKRLFIGLGMVVAFLLLGCTETEAPKQQLCDDGRTIVTKVSDCPIIDMAYLECEKASTSSDYYGTSDRDMCFYNLAIDRENISLCRKIHSTDTYDTYAQDKCGSQIAMILDDPTLCDDLVMSAKYSCYQDIVTELQDPSICDSIASASKKDDCIYNYVSSNYYYIKDWSICGKLTDASTDRNYCYSLAASGTQDTKYCDLITGSYAAYYSYSDKVGCYSEVAKLKRNPALCDKLADGQDRDNCYYKYATSYPYDTPTCSKITDANTKGDCVYYSNSTYY